MTARPRDAGWFAGAALVLAVAVLVGASIGPAGPPWWRVPLALIDHLPLVSLDSGVSQAEWNILWKIRMHGPDHGRDRPGSTRTELVLELARHLLPRGREFEPQRDEQGACNFVEDVGHRWPSQEGTT